ncbi:unnamed protein product, partial [Linum tenue]
LTNTNINLLTTTANISLPFLRSFRLSVQPASNHGDQHSDNSARRHRQRQLPLHLRRLRRPRLEPDQPFRHPNHRPSLHRRPRRRRGSHLLPRLLLQLLPLLQLGRARSQAGNPDFPDTRLLHHPEQPFPSPRRVPGPGQQEPPPDRNAHLRHRICFRVRVSDAGSGQRGSTQARDVELRQLPHLRRSRPSGDFCSRCYLDLLFPGSLRFYSLVVCRFCC